MTDSTEQVYTMTDYYDGPRCGMADYPGRPHLYRSLWADIDDERDDVFELFPLYEETFTLAIEDWKIWQRWRAAFDRGEVSIDSHPALPADRQRHNELEMILKPRLTAFAESDTTVIGEFEWPQLDYRLQGAPARVEIPMVIQLSTHSHRAQGQMWEGFGVRPCRLTKTYSE